jgi:hypothetical protein
MRRQVHPDLTGYTFAEANVRNSHFKGDFIRHGGS